MTFGVGLVELHDLVYSENDYMYYDTYLGGEKFAGEGSSLDKRNTILEHELYWACYRKSF